MASVDEMSPPLDMGNFELNIPDEFSSPDNRDHNMPTIAIDQIATNNFGLTDSDEDELLSMQLDDIQYLAASNVLSDVETQKMEQYLHSPDLEELPPPETPCLSSRFYKASSEEIEHLFEEKQSKNTKKNTSWGMRVFQDWKVETSGHQMDMQNVTVDNLAECLGRFYAEARPKNGTEDNSSIGLYHKNSLISIRGAINRHMTDIHRNVDVIRDKEFRKANGVLDGLLKQRARSGGLKPTQHKPIIERHDLSKISTYLSNGKCNPEVLRHNVWFNLSIHFVTRGMEFHHQLLTNSVVKPRAMPHMKLHGH